MSRTRTVRRAGALVAIAMALWLIAAPAGALEGETFAVTGVDFEAGTVTVTNHGEADVDPNGLIVCNFPDYAPISGATKLAPGESLVVDLASISIPAAASGGELGLYLTNDFGNSDAIVSYVEWGSSDHERSPVAQGAGVWDGGVVDGDAAVLGTTSSFPIAASAWTAVPAAEPIAEELPFTGISTPAIVLIGVLLVGVGAAVLFVDGRSDPRRQAR